MEGGKSDDREVMGVGEESKRAGAHPTEEAEETARGQALTGSRGSRKDLGLCPENTEEHSKCFKQGDGLFRFSL